MASRLYAPGGGRRVDVLAQAALCACVAGYWSVLRLHTLRLVPSYAGELKAIAQANWLTMWTWVDYGQYFRYSPTALLPLGLIDRDLLAPILGISFPSPEFAAAKRLIPVFIALFVLIALCTYRLCRFFGLGVPASLAAGFFIGLNKGFAYYFRFASTIATSLLILYAIGVVFFGIRYLRTRRPLDLMGYYLALLLAVGAWEQWINLLVFLAAGSLILVVRLRDGRTRAIAVHGILIPLCVGGGYLALHFTTISRESTAVNEAQNVFSYPSVALMIEDLVVNVSHHLASVVEPLFFPWPMLSQSVLQRFNMEVYNAYNKTYTPFSGMHYRGIADWYAGLLFGLMLCATLVLVWYFCRYPAGVLPGAVGLGLTWTGFLVHLPIMYRTYFALPGAASLLDYKHPLSILGFSLVVGWGIQNALDRIPSPSAKVALWVLLVGWMAYCNYGKVTLSSQFAWGTYPW